MADVDAGVLWGRLRAGMLSKILPDSADSGFAPDEVLLAGGKVTLTPTREWVRFPGAGGRLPNVLEVVATVKSGEIWASSDAAEPGVSLLAFEQPNMLEERIQYRAKFDLVGVKNQPPDVLVNVAVYDGTPESVTLLSSFLPAVPVMGVERVVSTEDRLAAEAAAEVAVDAAVTAETFATANLPALITAAEERAETVATDRFDTELDAATAALLADPASDVRVPVDALLAGKANTTHAHTAADVTGGVFNAARIPAASETAAGGVELATVTEATTGTDTARAVTPAGLKAVADTKAATSHTHTTAQVTGLDTALAGKADTTHTHTTAQVTGLDAAIADTGNVNLSTYITSGTGTLTGRKVGKLVELVGTGVGASVATGTLTEFLNALPAEWRPATDRRGAAFFSSTGAADGVVTIRSSGTGYLVQTSGTTRALCSFSVVWIA